MGFDDISKALNGVWEYASNESEHLLKWMDDVYHGAHHAHDDPAQENSQESLQRLKDQFEEHFGKDGNLHLATVATDPEFNGAGKDNEEDYYPGLHFSLPLALYLARRTLDTHEPEKAYELFIDHVDQLVEKQDATITHYPTAAHLEEICAPHIDALQNQPELEGTEHDDHRPA
tara:strand:+ start:13072 stop:13593 length:522 start_codon:yes stop_codon:yes gene_type:complete